jgi:hypothetical protein
MYFTINLIKKFFRIDYYHKMWMNGQRPVEIPHLLLNSYFAELELVKRGIVAATISPANGHGKQQTIIQTGSHSVPKCNTEWIESVKNKLGISQKLKPGENCFE